MGGFWVGEPPMAASHSTSLSLAPKPFRKPLIPPFSIRSESGLPSIPVKRKNYLRRKILKTLDKPYPSTPAAPDIPIESPLLEPQPVEASEPLFLEEGEVKANEEASSVREFQVSEPVVVSVEERRSLGKLSPTTVLRYGFYVVVVFLLQKVFAVLFSGDGNPEQVNGGSDGLSRNSSKEIGRRKYLLDKNGKVVQNGVVFTDSSNVLYWDEPELEKKIEEIRNMAREARKSEKNELKNDDEDGDLESPNSRVRMDIEKEIGARLNNVEKSINSKLKSENEATKVNQPLLFKKKLKSKAHGRKAREEVKGFPGMKQSAPKSKNSFGNGLNPAENQDTLQGTGEKGKKTQNDLGTANGTTEPGPQLKLQNQESKRNKKPTSSLGAPEKPEGSSGSSSNVQSRNSQSESRKIGAKLPGNMVNKKQSGTETDMWWLDLPYVLGILAHRALDDEKSEGFYTIRAEELSKSSYMVAFEDHGDARNFCYLLESYFEDLGDFHTNIVPLSVQELSEAMKADAKKVVVVRKGQLKLYVGQPFEEVETALRSLVVEQDRIKAHPAA